MSDRKKGFRQLCVIFIKKQHGARPCVEKMQLIFFVPPNEELEIAPPKIWMYPQKCLLLKFLHNSFFYGN
jgi:hypothetical protein